MHHLVKSYGAQGSTLQSIATYTLRLIQRETYADYSADFAKAYS